MSNKFDFSKAIAKAKAKLEDKKLNAIVLAPSGGGKSSLMGTIGVPTLYLYCTAESHGPQQATAFATGDITPICIDDERTADESLEFIKAILSDKEFLKSYGAIALDSITSLEAIVRESMDFKSRCLTSQNKHNNFAEPAAINAIIGEILSLLKASEKHVVTTLALDVRSLDGETGEILEASPKLSTYSCAEFIIMNFGDVMIIGPLTKDEKTAHRIQFGGKVSKASKDAAGHIKKLINFTPRVSGVKTLPNSLPAKLSDVIKLKEGGK
jgi:hypothetical protein